MGNKECAISKQSFYAPKDGRRRGPERRGYTRVEVQTAANTK